MIIKNILPRQFEVLINGKKTVFPAGASADYDAEQGTGSAAETPLTVLASGTTDSIDLIGPSVGSYGYSSNCLTANSGNSYRVGSGCIGVNLKDLSKNKLNINQVLDEIKKHPL